MYLIFAGTSYYASGGANDLYRSDIDNESESVMIASSLMGKTIKCEDGECLIDDDDECLCNGEVEWVNVYCTNTNQIIHSNGSPYGVDGGVYGKTI